MDKHILSSALDVGEWAHSRHGRFIPGTRFPYSHWIEG